MNRLASSVAIAAGLATFALVLAAPAQSAEDFKFVAPVDCEPYGPGTQASEIQVTATGIYNPGTSAELVLCPMPRDQDDPFISGDVQVTAYYRALGANSATMACTLYVGSTSMQGTAVYSASATGPFASNGARNQLTINGATQTQAFSAVPVNVLCSIGPKVSFGGIFWSEEGPTNTP